MCLPQNTLSWSAAMSLEGELLLICEIQFSVGFYVIRTVHIFDYSRVINWTANKQRLVESDGHIFWRDPYVFSASFAQGYGTPHPSNQGQSFTPNEQSIRSSTVSNFRYANKILNTWGKMENFHTDKGQQSYTYHDGSMIHSLGRSKPPIRILPISKNPLLLISHSWW